MFRARGSSTPTDSNRFESRRSARAAADNAIDKPADAPRRAGVSASGDVERLDDRSFGAAAKRYTVLLGDAMKRFAADPHDEAVSARAHREPVSMSG